MTYEKFLIECVARVANGVEAISLADCVRVIGAVVVLAIVVLGFIAFLNGLFDEFSKYFEKKRTRKRYLKKHRFDRFRINALPNQNFLVYEDMDEGGEFPLYVLTNPYNAQLICDVLNMDKIGAEYTLKGFKKLSDSLQAEDIENLKTTENSGEKE